MSTARQERITLYRDLGTAAFECSRIRALAEDVGDGEPYEEASGWRWEGREAMSRLRERLRAAESSVMASSKVVFEGGREQDPGFVRTMFEDVRHVLGDVKKTREFLDRVYLEMPEEVSDGR